MINRFDCGGRLVRFINFHVYPTSNGQGNPSLLFTIASPRNFKNRQGNYDTDYFNCSASRQSAQYLHNNAHPGDLILIDGSMHQRTYTSHHFFDQNGRPARLHTYVVTVEDAQVAHSRRNIMAMTNGNPSPQMPPRNMNRPPYPNRRPRPNNNQGGLPSPNNNFPRRGPRAPRNPMQNPMNRPQMNQQPNRPPVRRNMPNNTPRQNQPTSQRFTNQRPINTTNNNPMSMNKNTNSTSKINMNPNNNSSSQSKNKKNNININDDDLPF